MQVLHLESGMEEFEPSSWLGIGNGGVRAKFKAWNRKWKSSSQVLCWNREWRSSSQVRILESEMEEFKPSSDARNWEWKSSSKVRGLVSEMEVFKPISDAWNR